jgi:SAM-dependent methyltransferase
LDAARPYFSFRAGTDYSPAAVRGAEAVADRVYLGGLEVLETNERFDVIVLNQVIEHVYRPVPFLRELRQRLSPDGRIVLATPDMNSPLRYLLGSRWPSYKIPEHVIYFDHASLARTMGEAGFDSITRVPYPHAFPLGVLLEKFRLPRPGALDSFPVWVPWTTLALYGKKAIA